MSCKASLAALRLYDYFCDIVVMMLLSENKYDDDDLPEGFYVIPNAHSAVRAASLRNVAVSSSNNNSSEAQSRMHSAKFRSEFNFSRRTLCNLQKDA